MPPTVSPAHSRTQLAMKSGRLDVGASRYPRPHFRPGPRHSRPADLLMLLAVVQAHPRTVCSTEIQADFATSLFITFGKLRPAARNRAVLRNKSAATAAHLFFMKIYCASSSQASRWRPGGGQGLVTVASAGLGFQGGRVSAHAGQEHSSSGLVRCDLRHCIRSRIRLARSRHPQAHGNTASFARRRSCPSTSRVHSLGKARVVMPGREEPESPRRALSRSIAHVDVER